MRARAAAVQVAARGRWQGVLPVASGGEARWGPPPVDFRAPVGARLAVRVVRVGQTVLLMLTLVPEEIVAPVGLTLPM